MDNLNIIFQWIVRFFRDMGAPGFCNASQNQSDIGH